MNIDKVQKVVAEDRFNFLYYRFRLELACNSPRRKCVCNPLNPRNFFQLGGDILIHFISDSEGCL